MKEISTYEVWQNETREFIPCRGIEEAFKIAERVKGRVWLAIEEEGRKAYCAIITNAKTK
jgi:hypothetical protein